MKKRRASMVCSRAGRTGTIHLFIKGSGPHPLNGMTGVLVTDRYSGFLVELTHTKGVYRAGERVTLAPENFIFHVGTNARSGQLLRLDM